MTVAELIEKLKEFDGDLEVFVYDIDFDSTRFINIETIENVNLVQTKNKLTTSDWAEYCGLEVISDNFNGVLIR